MTEDEIKQNNDEWLQRTWRPAVGVTYIVINVFDFIIFPILWSAFSVYSKGEMAPWQPLTLEATGLFHLAFGAILGVAAWSRGQEKLAGVDINRYSNRRSSRRYDDTFDDPEYADNSENSATYRGEQ
jgi:hypothetical protein